MHEQVSGAHDLVHEHERNSRRAAGAGSPDIHLIARLLAWGLVDISVDLYSKLQLGSWLAPNAFLRCEHKEEVDLSLFFLSFAQNNLQKRVRAGVRVRVRVIVKTHLLLSCPITFDVDVS